MGVSLWAMAPDSFLFKKKKPRICENASLMTTITGTLNCESLIRYLIIDS